MSVGGKLRSLSFSRRAKGKNPKQRLDEDDEGDPSGLDNSGGNARANSSWSPPTDPNAGKEDQSPSMPGFGSAEFAASGSSKGRSRLSNPFKGRSRNMSKDSNGSNGPRMDFGPYGGDAGAFGVGEEGPFGSTGAGGTGEDDLDDDLQMAIAMSQVQAAEDEVRRSMGTGHAGHPPVAAADAADTDLQRAIELSTLEAKRADTQRAVAAPRVPPAPPQPDLLGGDLLGASPQQQQPAAATHAAAGGGIADLLGSLDLTPQPAQQQPPGFGGAFDDAGFQFDTKPLGSTAAQPPAPQTPNPLATPAADPFGMQAQPVQAMGGNYAPNYVQMHSQQQQQQQQQAMFAQQQQQQQAMFAQQQQQAMFAQQQQQQVCTHRRH